MLNSLVSKIVTGLLVLAVVAGGISWWQLDPAARHAVLSGVGQFVAWLGVVLLLPWATFFLIGRVARLESNAAGAALVGIYTLLEAAWLGWVYGWAGHGPAGWTLLAAAVLFAAAYNVLVCDWIADRLPS